MNEIQLYKQTTPQNIIDMGMVLGKSGNFGFTKQEQGVTMMVICATENITPLTFMRTYHVMPDGKFSKKAMAAYAEFRKMGGKVEWKKTGDEDAPKPDERCATAIFDFEGNKLTVSYSIADAKKEGVYKSGSRYEKRPGQMLRARVLTNALGMLAPEIFAGDDEDFVPPADSVLDLNKPAESKTTVVTTAPDTEAELAKTGLAPLKTEPAKPAEPAKPIEVTSTVTVEFEPVIESDGKLSAATTTEICKRIGAANGPAAIEWMVKSKWINEAGDISTLSLARAKKIINNAAGFLAHAKIGQPAK